MIQCKLKYKRFKLESLKVLVEQRKLNLVWKDLQQYTILRKGKSPYGSVQPISLEIFSPNLSERPQLLKIEHGAQLYS